jgi:hypothetical protein
LVDRKADRDLTWAREDEDPGVRLEVAWADAANGYDLTWAREDEDRWIRMVAVWADWRVRLEAERAP